MDQRHRDNWCTGLWRLRGDCLIFLLATKTNTPRALWSAPEKSWHNFCVTVQKHHSGLRQRKASVSAGFLKRPFMICVYEYREKWHLRRNDPSVLQAWEVQRWRASAELLRSEHHPERRSAGGDRYVPRVCRLFLQQPGTYLQSQRRVRKGR